MQDIFFITDPNRVAGVGAALKTHDHLGLAGEQIHDLALALVPPLEAHHATYGHESVLSCVRLMRAAT